MVDKRIPLGELTAYERWELPNIGEPSAKAEAAPKAEKIKPPTAEQIEAITKQAYEAGFEEGYKAGLDKGLVEGREQGHSEGLELGNKAGHEQGLAQGQSEVDARLAQLEQQISQIIDPVAAQQQQVQEAMLNVAVALSRAVIHRELSIDSSSLKVALGSILDDLPASDKGAVLRVNEQDFDVIQSLLSRFKANIELVSDSAIMSGGFSLKTSSQLIDYTIEKRFQKAVQGMLSAAMNGPGETMQEVPSSIDSLSDFSSDTLSSPIEESDLVPEEPSSSSDATNAAILRNGSVLSEGEDAPVGMDMQELHDTEVKNSALSSDADVADIDDPDQNQVSDDDDQSV